MHNDGDGTTEGWFRAPDGGFVTTEPVASEDWMPLNDYPTEKPTYDFSDAVTAGRTVVAKRRTGLGAAPPASREFPGGSVTWNWHAGMPIASYLVEDSVGNTALRQLQRAYGGSSISEAQLEAAFRQWLPVHSSSCEARLGEFFTQWFDTAYPSGGGANRPMITGPGLAGPGFYSGPGKCS